MNGEIRPKAEQFARALKGSSPVSQFLQAETALKGDGGAQRLIARLQEAQRELWFKQRDGSLTQQDIQELRELQGQIQQNETITEFIEGQNGLFAFTQQVAAELSQALGVDFGAVVAPPSSC